MRFAAIRSCRNCSLKVHDQGITLTLADLQQAARPRGMITTMSERRHMPVLASGRRPLRHLSKERAGGHIEAIRLIEHKVVLPASQHLQARSMDCGCKRGTVSH